MKIIHTTTVQKYIFKVDYYDILRERDMIIKNRYLKSNIKRAILPSESSTQKECVLPKNEQQNLNKNKSANVTFTGGFFSTKNQDSINFSSAPKAPKKGFWERIGEKESVKKFFRDPKFHKFLDASNNLAVMESIFVLAISTTIKPVTIMALPGAKEEDKKYAATKAFLGGVVDYCLITVLVKPFTKKVEALGKRIKEHPEIIKEKVKYLRDEGNFKTFSKVVGYAPKILLIPVRSALTIALIPPTLKYIFPEEGKKLNPKKGGEKK